MMKTMAALVLAFLIFVSVAGADFVDVTSGPIGDTGRSTGSCWFDYDNDGDPDMFWGSIDGANRLLRNEGNDQFVDVTSGPLGDTSMTFAVCQADYDNDFSANQN